MKNCTQIKIMFFSEKYFKIGNRCTGKKYTKVPYFRE